MSEPESEFPLTLNSDDIRLNAGRRGDVSSTSTGKVKQLRSKVILRSPSSISDSILSRMLPSSPAQQLEIKFMVQIKFSFSLFLDHVTKLFSQANSL